MPDEMRKIEYVVRTIKKVYESYGYDPLETPAFESWDLLKAKCGEEVERQIYKFRDKKGRELGLRFDFTVSLARIIASNPVLPKPFRRYQVSRVWRYERPEARRRFREFWQADVDIVGSDKPECDAEALAVASDCLEALGFKDFSIRLSNRKILEGLAKAIGIPESKHLAIFRIIDKLEKVRLQDVKKELTKELKGMKEPEKTTETLLKYVKMKGGKEILERKEIREILKNTVGEQGLNELKQILDKAESFGVSKRIIIDFSLARGLDYYTGPVFEITIEKCEDVGSVAGGGRYDKLIELYGGEPTPATGISLGIDRIVKSMERKNLFKLPKTNTKVFVAPVNDEMSARAIQITQMLRKSGISTEVDLMGRKLSEQLKYADKRGIPYAVIVGREEVERGFVMLRDMEKAEQREVKIKNLLEEILGSTS
jgi:histidyl-tRNA synthetase